MGEPVVRAALLIALCLLAGCAALPQPQPAAKSPCEVHEASYECQVERYHNVNVP